MSKLPPADGFEEDDDPHSDEVVGDRELDGEDALASAFAVEFEVIDMVCHLGTHYALGYEMKDGDYADDLQAHRWMGPGKGFSRITDVNLIETLADLSVLHDDTEDLDEDAILNDDLPPAALEAVTAETELLTYAIVDTVAVDGVTWTLGRAIDPRAPEPKEGAVPDVYRYEGHGKSFALANDISAELRARIEDEVRGFEQIQDTFERIDFDLQQIVEHEGSLYALGFRHEDLEAISDDPRKLPPTRVWRHLGDGEGFELVDTASPVHRDVTVRFPLDL